MKSSHCRVIRNEQDSAKRTKTALSVAVTPIALAAMMLAALPRTANALNECGADTVGASSVTCSGASYATGIQYTGSDGLTLNLNNPAMVAQGGSGAAVVILQGGGANDLTINATSLTSISGVGRGAISLTHTGSGTGTIAIGSGSFSSNAASVVTATNNSGGDLQITMTGGQVTSTFNGFGGSGLSGSVGGTATGNLSMTMSGGSIQTSGTTSIGVRAQVSNFPSSSAVSITMTGGSVDSAGQGLQANNSGRGEATVTMTGGTVLARNGRAVAAVIGAGASPADAKVVMQVGSATAQGTNAVGLSSQVNGSGRAIVQMGGGTVDALANNADGILATSASGTYAVDVTGGTVTGGAGFGAGIHTVAAKGGTLNIGGGAIINAGGSGVAIRDGDIDRNGTDETGGNATITTAGTINGGVVLGGGTDTLTVTGGAINGNIAGDGADSLTFNLGAGSFTQGPAFGITGMKSVVMNSGTVQLDSTITDASTVTVNGGTLVLGGANSYTGGTFLNGGVLSVSKDANLGDAAGALTFDGGTLRASADFATARTVVLGAGGGTFQVDANLAVSSGITGAGSLTKTGAGALTLSGTNTYGGSTNVAQGTLRAGAANTLSAASAHSVAAGAALDLAGFNQTVASLANSGTVSLMGAAPGTTLTVNGNYVGNNGVLKLGTALNAAGSADRLVINGGTATGKTSVQVTNLGGLGALTSGNGIEVITAQNGATTTAQTTKDAFSLAGGHVDAGAYEYRLYAADAAGAGENWFLRSTTNAVTPPTTPGAPTVPVVTYRAEASLYAALPNQLRQGNLAMLADLRKRVGDDDVKGAATTPTGSDRRAWARMLSTDIDIQQGGTVSPRSKGHLTGFQAGTDLLATSNVRAGLYVGQLDGDATVNGFASGVNNLRTGRNDLRSQYVGVYGTFTADSGLYADVVVQSGRHRYTVEPLLGGGGGGKGNSLLGSIEVGQSFALGGSGWAIEPQLQLIHQHMDLGNSTILGAVVQPEADSGWIARAGVRVKGQIDTGIGALQPYGRFNVYRTSSGADVARFVNGATRTDIAAPTGGTSTELAGGFTLALGPRTSLYGEVGKLWSSGGDAKIKSSINGSLGVRVLW